MYLCFRFFPKWYGKLQLKQLNKRKQLSQIVELFSYESFRWCVHLQRQLAEVKTRASKWAVKRDRWLKRFDLCLWTSNSSLSVPADIEKHTEFRLFPQDSFFSKMSFLHSGNKSRTRNWQNLSLSLFLFLTTSK